MATLQQAIVRSLPGETNMIITLTVGGKQRNMDRPKGELLEKPLGRLQKSAAPQLDKQQRRQKGKQAVADDAAAAAPAAAGGAVAEGALFVGLHAGPTADHPVLDAAAVTNEDAWRHGRLLRVGVEQYRVCLNPPLLDRLEVHGRPFVGIPLVPAVQLHFADEAACRWRWFRQRPGSDSWEGIEGATSRRYVPTPDDAGCRLKVQCTPGRPAAAGASAAAAACATEQEELLLGDPGTAECGPVEVPPVVGASAARHALTSCPTGSPELRVVTYNILADQYASTETAKNVIFAHCPPQFLEPDRRRPLVLAELLGFNADIICLQEVDEKAFTAYLAPQLEVEGFQGVYTNKAGKAGLSVREGSATFFRTSRFKLAARRNLTLKEFFPAQPGAPAKYGDVFGPMLRSSPALQQALQRVATVAQLSLLAPVHPGDRPLCVLNTHLFFHYMAPHIRTMHVWAMMQEAQQFIAEAVGDADVAAQLGGQQPALLFCGDLNSDLNDGISGAIELLDKGKLPAHFWDWAFGAQFKWEKGEPQEGASGGAGGGANSGAHAGDSAQQPAGAAAAADGGGSSGWGEVEKQVESAVEHAHAHHPASPAPSTVAGGGCGSGGGGNGQAEAEFVCGVDLSIPFSLRPADGLRTPFTNHVKGYQGLLDYIWYEPSALSVVREVPLPSLQELGGYLPSERFPSDHLPVVFDLRFTQPGEGDRQRSGTTASSSSGEGQAGAASSSGGDGAGSKRGAGNVLPAAMYNVGLAAEAVARSEVIAVPTDTLYGLAACANSSAAVSHIYTTKRRGDHKPLAIAVADVADVPRFAEVQHLPEGLLEELLPGAVTLLLQRRSDAPLAPELNPGVGAIGIRIPDAPFIRAVCRQHRGALALTSANVSGGISSIQVEEFEELWPSCSLVFDAGQLDAGRSGSTVIDLTQPAQFSISRRGSGFARTMQLLQDKYSLTQRLE